MSALPAFAPMSSLQYFETICSNFGRAVS